MTGVLILNFNNSAYTIGCIESILKVNTALIKIIVVDNASTDNSVNILQEYLMEHQGSFELLQSPENGGYARGNNFGLQVFESDNDISEILILNNDVLFTSDIIPTMLDFLNSHPEAGLVSPLLMCADGKTIDNTCARKDCSIAEIIWTYILYFTNRFGILSSFSNKRKILLSNPEAIEKPFIEIELPSGSCMMIKKELFKQIGYFDPNTFLYYEENILYRKLLPAGKVNYMIPGISCIHLGGKTTNKVEHSASYMKNSKASGYYYATTYRDLNIIQRTILKLVYLSYNAMVTIVKFFKGNHK